MPPFRHRIGGLLEMKEAANRGRPRKKKEPWLCGAEAQ